MKVRLIAVGVAAWVAIVGGLAYHSVRNDPPTAREQTTVASAVPTVDEALARIAQALAGEPVVAVLSPYHQISRDCRVTTVRDGARFERVLTVYTRYGAEPGLLDRIAAELRERYRVGVRHRDTSHQLDFDAGSFVVVRGVLEVPGRLRFAADTGCRPHPDPLPAQPDPAGDRAPVQAVLDALGLATPTWRATRLPCPSGDPLWTVEALAGPSGASLARLASTAASGALVVQAFDDVYAYRSGLAGVAVRVGDAGVTVSATSGCAG